MRAIDEVVAQAGMRIAGLDSLLKDWPGLPPQAPDLYRLYRHIRHWRPEYVVEYGSGCSTLVMAAALHANGQGRLFTYEANSKYCFITRLYTPRSGKGSGATVTTKNPPGRSISCISMDPIPPMSRGGRTGRWRLTRCCSRINSGQGSGLSLMAGH